MERRDSRRDGAKPRLDQHDGCRQGSQASGDDGEVLPRRGVTDYASLAAGLQNDAKDRHVVAAAVKSGAQVITTSNLKDFTPLPEGLEAQSPDEFLFDLDPHLFLEMLREQAGDLQKPPVTFDALLERLSRAVPDLVAAVRQLGGRG